MSMNEVINIQYGADATVTHPNHPNLIFQNKSHFWVSESKISILGMYLFDSDYHQEYNVDFIYWHIINELSCYKVIKV